MVKIKKIENGKIPVYKTDGAVAADCFARVKTEIKAMEHVKVPLGFAIEIPQNVEVQVRGRSGLTSKGILVQLGTVDYDYRGEISAMVYNATKNDFVVNEGDRICQIVFNEIKKPSFQEVDELSETERGSGGFGSTGIN